MRVTKPVVTVCEKNCAIFEVLIACQVRVNCVGFRWRAAYSRSACPEQFLFHWKVTKNNGLTEGFDRSMKFMHKRTCAARNGAGEGNRTLVCSLGSCRSTIELHPQSGNLKPTTTVYRSAGRKPIQPASLPRKNALLLVVAKRKNSNASGN